jgi:hypothetical protein
MTEVLGELLGNADIVVIDSPPLLAVTDAAVLAAKADGVVLVTALGETHRGAAHRAKELLDASGARLLGVVVNKTPKSDRGYYNQYYAKYGGDAVPADAVPADTGSTDAAWDDDGDAIPHEELPETVATVSTVGWGAAEPRTASADVVYQASVATVAPPIDDDHELPSADEPPEASPLPAASRPASRPARGLLTVFLRSLAAPRPRRDR